MITSGLTIEAADGLHDDSWCWPTTRLTLRTEIDAEELRLGVWFKPEDGQNRTLMTVAADGGSTNANFITFDSPTEISVPGSWTSGEIVSVRLSTPHRASRSPAEQRDLSFCLLSVVAI